MLKKREKIRITKEKGRVYKRYNILIIAAFVLTPLVCLAHTATAQDPEISPLIAVIAGQNITVGEVWIWNDDQNLYAKYKTNDPWYMTETHLYVGKNLPATPVAPGHFPHSYENPNGFGEQTYTVSLSALGVQPEERIYILAHAVVKKDRGQEETAWRQGRRIGQRGDGWAMYNTYQIEKVPWITVGISGTELIWDIFKPGRYMSLGPVFRIASNVAVVISYGTGGADSALGPAVRKGSLLSNISGTSPDEITLWATCRWGEPTRPHAVNPKSMRPTDRISGIRENLFTHWIEFTDLNGYQMRIPEGQLIKTFTWYNMISVDPSLSEGRYFEQFVVTISAVL